MCQALCWAHGMLFVKYLSDKFSNAVRPPPPLYRGENGPMCLPKVTRFKWRLNLVCLSTEGVNISQLGDGGKWEDQHGQHHARLSSLTSIVCITLKLARHADFRVPFQTTESEPSFIPRWWVCILKFWCLWKCKRLLVWRLQIREQASASLLSSQFG